MNRLPPLVALAFLLSWTPARAQDADNDAPASVPAPMPLAWRVPPAVSGSAATRPNPREDAPSLALLRDLARAIASEPDCKAKADIEASLDGLIRGAEKRKFAERQAWIDHNLGELNAAIRSLGKEAPKPLALKAASAAAGLNNRAERWEDGRELAGIALGCDPEDKDALIGRSQASAGLGDYARAYADADAVLCKVPDSAAGLTARAASAYGLGNYLKAVEDSRRALSLDPNDKTAYALMKLSEGRVSAAPRFENSSLAESVEREYHGMIQQLGQVEFVRQAPLGHLTDQSLRRFLETAGSKLAVKDYYGAIEEADKVLALEPDNANALYYRAAAENLLGRYGAAARDASRGLALTPSVSSLRDARAWAYIHMGRFTDAIADANHSLEIDPGNPYAFANRGHAHEGRGNYEAMAADLKTAAELNAQFEPDYRDSTRRHGLRTERLKRGARPPLSERAGSYTGSARARSFAVMFAFSLIGGLLIGLGLLHVGAGARESRGRLPGVPSILEARYEIGRPIGQGGMGVVYEAHDKRLNRPVAVKMLRDEYQLDDEAKQAFVEEARTVAELRHPSIVEIHAVEQDERGLYLIFERLEGRTLDELIAERKRLPLSEAKRVLGAVCAALDYAHARNVIHRDLKPGNVMLTSEGGVKVFDFGISRHAARADSAGASQAAATTQNGAGTPHYMAPEQERGFVRKENDVFALGAVLYEMLTGARPYEDSASMPMAPAKLAKSYRQPSRRVSGLSLELDALIDRALEPDPDKRIPSASAFWDQLDAIPG